MPVPVPEAPRPDWVHTTSHERIPVYNALADPMCPLAQSRGFRRGCHPSVVPPREPRRRRASRPKAKGPAKEPAQWTLVDGEGEGPATPESVGGADTPRSTASDRIAAVLADWSTVRLDIVSCWGFFGVNGHVVPEARAQAAAARREQEVIEMMEEERRYREAKYQNRSARQVALASRSRARIGDQPLSTPRGPAPPAHSQRKSEAPGSGRKSTAAPTAALSSRGSTKGPREPQPPKRRADQPLVVRCGQVCLPQAVPRGIEELVRRRPPGEDWSANLAVRVFREGQPAPTAVMYLAADGPVGRCRRKANETRYFAPEYILRTVEKTPIATAEARAAHRLPALPPHQAEVVDRLSSPASLHTLGRIHAAVAMGSVARDDCWAQLLTRSDVVPLRVEIAAVLRDDGGAIADTVPLLEGLCTVHSDQLRQATGGNTTVVVAEGLRAACAGDSADLFAACPSLVTHKLLPVDLQYVPGAPASLRAAGGTVFLSIDALFDSADEVADLLGTATTSAPDDLPLRATTTRWIRTAAMGSSVRSASMMNGSMERPADDSPRRSYPRPPSTPQGTPRRTSLAGSRRGDSVRLPPLEEARRTPSSGGEGRPSDVGVRRRANSQPEEDEEL